MLTAPQPHGGSRAGLGGVPAPGSRPGCWQGVDGAATSEGWTEARDVPPARSTHGAASRPQVLAGCCWSRGPPLEWLLVVAAPSTRARPPGEERGSAGEQALFLSLGLGNGAWALLPCPAVRREA